MCRMLRMFLTTVLAVAAAVFVFTSPVGVSAADEPVIEYNGDGTIRVEYTVPSGDQVLVLTYNTSVAGAKKYYYQLSEGKNKAYIPMSDGKGTYKLYIGKVRDDGKLGVIKSSDIELTEEDAESAFAIAHFIVNYKASDKYIKKASTLTKSSKNDLDKIKKVYNYIIKNYAYDYELLEEKANTSYYVPNNDKTYDRGVGICYDISCLFVSMLRSVDVEARIVTGHCTPVAEYHAWTQVYDSDKDKWYSIDPCSGMCYYNKTKSTKKFDMIQKDKDYSDIVYYY